MADPIAVQRDVDANLKGGLTLDGLWSKLTSCSQIDYLSLAVRIKSQFVADQKICPSLESQQIHRNDHTAEDHQFTPSRQNSQ
jgi:hypothetical protein